MIELVQNEEPVLFRPANWNDIQDEMDKITWDQLCKQFWMDTNFPISNDRASWNSMSEDEQWLVMRVFTGLTLLDTLQGHVGAPALVPDSVTDQEVAVFRNIGFMEEMHAKSYSTIFQTLAHSNEIERAFRWSEANTYLQEKARIVYRNYVGDDALKKKIASALLEGFLFYSGFFLPLYLNGHGKLTNTADLIRTIIKDESVHAVYIGYKFQKGFNELSEEEQAEMRDWTYEFLFELYNNEVKYTEDLYDQHGLTEEVKRFLRYNANKTLQNLGFDPLFAEEETQVMSIVIQSLENANETHDFFSSTGNYVVPDGELTSDSDWGNTDDDDDDEW